MHTLQFVLQGVPRSTSQTRRRVQNGLRLLSEDMINPGRWCDSDVLMGLVASPLLRNL